MFQTFRFMFVSFYVRNYPIKNTIKMVISFLPSIIRHRNYTPHANNIVVKQKASGRHIKCRVNDWPTNKNIHTNTCRNVLWAKSVNARKTTINKGIKRVHKLNCLLNFWNLFGIFVFFFYCHYLYETFMTRLLYSTHIQYWT